MLNAMDRERAAGVAVRALGFIAGDSERLGVFLASCGAEAEDLRRQARDPAFLGFVLDFLLMEDESVLAFASEAGLDPHDVAAARRALPGGDVPEWT